jgi:hypothetical protein
MFFILPANPALFLYVMVTFMLGLFTPLLAHDIGLGGHDDAATLLVGAHIACIGFPIFAFIRGQTKGGQFCGHSSGLWPVAGVVAYLAGFMMMHLCGL